MANEVKMFLGARASTFRNAEILRKNETIAEKILWAKLRKRQLGVKFRRQHPILGYVVDFYCHSHRLVIELDGEDHNTAENQASDRLRTEELEQNGLRVIRFENCKVINHIDEVLKEIGSVLNHQTPLSKPGRTSIPPLG